jgi:hypothetical protein
MYLKMYNKTTFKNAKYGKHHYLRKLWKRTFPAHGGYEYLSFDKETNLTVELHITLNQMNS